MIAFKINFKTFKTLLSLYISYIGLIRDVTNSYPICIHAQSVCIFLCGAAWSIEYLIEFIQQRKEAKIAAAAVALTDNNAPDITYKQ